MSSMAKINWGVVLGLLVCYLIAFSLAIAAEQHRSKAVVTYVSLSSNSTSENETTLNGTFNGNVTNYNGYYYCKYDSDKSSTYGVVGFVFLCITQVVIMGCTKCLCFDGEHKPGGMRACAVVSFGLLWLCFAIAEICFLAGANENSLRSSTREFVTGQQEIDKYLTCEMMHKGIFGAAGAFTFFSGVTGVCYYVCLVLSRNVIAPNWQGRGGDTPSSNLPNSSTSSSGAAIRPNIPNPYALSNDDLPTGRPSSQMTPTNDVFGANRSIGNMNRPLPGQLNRPPTNQPSPYSLG